MMRQPASAEQRDDAPLRKQCFDRQRLVRETPRRRARPGQAAGRRQQIRPGIEGDPQFAVGCDPVDQHLRRRAIGRRAPAPRKAARSRPGGRPCGTSRRRCGRDRQAAIPAAGCCRTVALFHDARSECRGRATLRRPQRQRPSSALGEAASARSRHRADRARRVRSRRQARGRPRAPWPAVAAAARSAREQRASGRRTPAWCRLRRHERRTERRRR